MSSREAAIRRTGQLMLQGWTLTSSHCAICHAVVVSKGSQMQCPQCELPIRIESAETSNPPEVVPIEEEVPRSLEEQKREWDRSRKRSDEISSKLGERMLGGWTLLGESCPLPSCNGTTLVSKNKG